MKNQEKELKEILKEETPELYNLLETAIYNINRIRKEILKMPENSPKIELLMISEKMIRKKFNAPIKETFSPALQDALNQELENSLIQIS